MKLTLIGTPGTIVDLQTYVAFKMTSKPAASLPKGLPKAPPTTLTWIVMESRYPQLRARTVAKQATPAPTYEAVVKTARGRAAASQPSCREELRKLVEEQQGTEHCNEYSRIYRQYHTGEGIDDFYAERIEALRAGQGV